jgi:hypothetical protein
MSVSLKRVITGTESISLDEAKLFLKQDATDDDTLVSGLITAARERAELLTGRTLIASTWTYNLDAFPYAYPHLTAPARTSYPSYVQSWVDSQCIYLPRAPLIEVTSLQYLQDGGNPTVYTTLDPSRYVVDTASEPARVCPVYNQFWPVALSYPCSVQLTYTAGYTSSVPEIILTVMKILITYFYENRDDSMDTPVVVERLLAGSRVSALGLRA